MGTLSVKAPKGFHCAVNEYSFGQSFVALPMLKHAKDNLGTSTEDYIFLGQNRDTSHRIWAGLHLK